MNTIYFAGEILSDSEFVGLGVFLFVVGSACIFGIYAFVRLVVTYGKQRVWDRTRLVQILACIALVIIANTLIEIIG